jgi:hypothetical protein
MEGRVKTPALSNGVYFGLKTNRSTQNDFEIKSRITSILIHPHPSGRLDLCSPMEKRTPECPVPLAVTIITEIFFYFTKMFLNVSLID